MEREIRQEAGARVGWARVGPLGQGFPMRNLGRCLFREQHMTPRLTASLCWTEALPKPQLISPPSCQMAPVADPEAE